MDDVTDLARKDASARADALDVTRSWLVQAPAGSGKTELLIQRFLALLAHVERPEQIVAMTFTRKAAAEMRQRVVDALRRATLGGEASTPHEALTAQLARDALEQDRRMAWRLLEQPARLRIVTIDALAAALARQAPLAAGLGALPAFVDDAQALHREAARAAIARAPAMDPHWQRFLGWLDNDIEIATRLLAQMLAGRDRWPAPLLSDPQALRADMERALAHELRAALDVLRTRLGASLATTLCELARMAADHFAASSEPPSFVPAVRALAESNDARDLDGRERWHEVANWLLTGKGAFSRGISANRHGFPPPGNGAGARERGERKRRFERWLEEAAATPGLADALHRIRSLPPERFGEDAWEFVVATITILPQSVSALESVIAARGEADFAEATLRALLALGAGDAPSDLLLAIDYRLSHLLIDEFQDTSRAQLALIARLTEGWQPGDGRTLFAVGDPMQSIYRFRQAEVRLFIEAQQQARVASVPVEIVELARNFRSQRAIVEWVNAVFGRVMPVISDASRGEAGYVDAYADPSKTPDIAPTIELVASRADEANAVVARIREAQAAGIERIAVLVRARSHAQALLPALRAARIDFSAVELEGLQDRLATRDLLSLARALAQPADRLAWLSILRAPWCALALADLLAIAEASAERPILDVITDSAALSRVSDDGRSRVARLVAAVRPALAARGSAGFVQRVRGAWLALGGPACIQSQLDRSGADRVLRLLARHERGGDLADADALAAEAAVLFAEPAEPGPGVVEIMTLHRAKGLQFDAVILPGLDMATGGGDAPLLRWRVRERDDTATLVLAPLRARIGAQTEREPVYEWLGELDAAEEGAELGRLLYVGATRAKRRLHVIAMAQCKPDEPAWKRPARGTALERLWDAIGDRLPPPLVSAVVADPAATPCDPLLRLPLDWRLPPLPARLPTGVRMPPRSEEPPFEWADAVAAAIGTVSHRLLAQIAHEGLAAWNERRLHDERERIMAELGSEGIEPELRERAAQRVATVIARTLSDPRGRWLFDLGHGDARSEWALAGEDEGRVVHVVIDRTFVCDGRRYIVDFKTGAHLGGDATAFLRREFERYRPQLARYARIVRALDPAPLTIALYHPLVEGGWQEEALR